LSDISEFQGSGICNMGPPTNFSEGCSDQAQKSVFHSLPLSWLHH